MAADDELVLFLGSVRRGEWEGLVEAGLPLGLLRDTSSVNCRVVPDGFRMLAEMDFTDGVDAVAGRVRDLQRHWDVRCVAVVFEGHVELAASVCERVGLRYLSPATAALVRDKTAMRDRLVRVLGQGCAGRHAAVGSAEDALRFAERVGYPVVLKPVRLHSSMLVRLCRSPEELAASVRLLAAAVPGYAEHAYVEHGGVAQLMHVEELVPGSNHSVDVIACGGACYPSPVVDVVTGAELGDDDFLHFARIAPSRLAAADQAAVQRLAVAATRALRVSVGVAHVELILSPSGPKVIEVAGRPGGSRHRVLQLAHGVDLMRAYVDGLLGRVPVLRPTRHRPAAIVSPYPSRAGVLTGYRLDAVRRLPGVLSVDPRAPVGSRVGPPRDGARLPLTVDVVAPDDADLDRVLARIHELREELFQVEQGGPGALCAAR